MSLMDIANSLYKDITSECFESDFLPKLSVILACGSSSRLVRINGIDFTLAANEVDGTNKLKGTVVFQNDYILVVNWECDG